VAEPLYVLRWQTPPPAARPGGPGRRSSMFEEVADELRDMPRTWGVIWEGPKRRGALANHINTGTIPSFRPAGTFEAVARRFGGTWSVYARYLGDGEAGDV